MVHQLSLLDKISYLQCLGKGDQPPINRADRRFRPAKEGMARKIIYGGRDHRAVGTIEIELGKGLAVVEACPAGITEQIAGWMNGSTANSSIRCTRRGREGANATTRTARMVRWGIGHRSRDPHGHTIGLSAERTEPMA
jgi:hypothetical protein